MSNAGIAKLAGEKFAGPTAVARNRDLARYEAAEMHASIGGIFGYSLFSESSDSRIASFEREATRGRRAALQRVGTRR